jgi:serine/threonine protein phosphatase PrpC
LASAIAVNTFQAFSPRLHEAIRRFEDEPTPEQRSRVLQLLEEACNASSRRIYEAAANTGRQGMTTTLVAAAIGGGTAFVAHVGDSRAYLLRDGELQQLTEDHSMVNELIRTGAMTIEDAATSRYRNVITRAVGLYPTVRADTLHVELLPHDRLLLCSDGLSDLVRTETLQNRFTQLGVAEAVDALVQDALDAGGRDNITVIGLEPEAVLIPEDVQERVEAMASLFLFEGLPFKARLRVGQIVNEASTTTGETLFEEGETGDAMYVVISGVYAVIVNGLEVATLGKGEHFGELCLIDKRPRSASIVCKEPGRLLTIKRSALQEFCMLEPNLGNVLLWKLVSTLGERLRGANAQLSPRRDTP